MKTLGSKTIASIRQTLNASEASRDAVVREALDAIAQNEKLNAIQSVIDSPSSENRNPKGRLAGVPFVAKDNINTRDLPTSAGTKALEAHMPAQNAPVIERLLDEGAVLVGKAGMHELAFGITSNNAAMGAIRNPHDDTRIPGGSSGGTAAAVAAGIVPFGLGTDTGGSCRIPAALCGVVGFRPSTGRYTSEGVVPISHTRDTVGPLANTVDDVVLLDAILSGKDVTATKRDAKSIVLGMDRSLLCSNLDLPTRTAFDATIERLREAGVKIVEIDLSPIWDHNAAFSFPVVLYEVMRDLPAYLSEHAPHVSFEKLVAGIASPDVRGAIESQLGEAAMPQAAYDAALNIHLPQMLEIYAQITQGLDAIIFPTTPLVAAKIGADETVDLNGEQVPTFPTYIRNTDLGSNIGAPGISIPAAVNDLPVGIELDGKPGEDAALLSVALTLENLIRKSLSDMSA